VTIDGLDREGQHLGGLIAPGVHLASQVLNASTSDIAAKRQAEDRKLDLFMDNTEGAVQAGALFSVVALVERAVDEMSRRLNARPQVIITGGDGERVRDKLNFPAQFTPDLVLRGLRLIAKRES
jgi:type III pantothenate kinase